MSYMMKSHAILPGMWIVPLCNIYICCICYMAISILGSISFIRTICLGISVCAYIQITLNLLNNFTKAD